MQRSGIDTIDTIKYHTWSLHFSILYPCDTSFLRCLSWYDSVFFSAEIELVIALAWFYGVITMWSMFFFMIHLRSDSTEFAKPGVLNDKLGSKFGEKNGTEEFVYFTFEKNDDPLVQFCNYLTFCIIMDSSLWFDTINIAHIQGCPVIIKKK